MQYYIITDSLAEELGLKKYRKGNASEGWLVNQGDIACIGTDKALEQGAIAVTDKEAKYFVNSINNK